MSLDLPMNSNGQPRKAALVAPLRVRAQVLLRGDEMRRPPRVSPTDAHSVMNLSRNDESKRYPQQRVRNRNGVHAAVTKESRREDQRR